VRTNQEETSSDSYCLHGVDGVNLSRWCFFSVLFLLGLCNISETKPFLPTRVILVRLQIPQSVTHDNKVWVCKERMSSWWKIRLGTG
jgi:hypothetical protein